MDCDQVFVALTAAPFPTGMPSDRSVEAHLAECEECRRFALALAPNHAEAPESLNARERRLLPAYRPANVLVRAGEGREGSATTFPGFSTSPTEAIYRPAMRQQVAAFTLSHQPLRNPLWDAFLLAVVLSVFAVVCWMFGMLVV